MPQIRIDDEDLANGLGPIGTNFTLDYNDEGRLENVTQNVYITHIMYYIKEIPFEQLPEWWLEKHLTYNPY